MRMRAAILTCLLSATLITTASGCNYFILLSYLIGGPPSIEPDYRTQTGHSLDNKDVVVAVVCYAPKEVLYSFAHVDRELMKFVSYRMHEHKIKVINPDRVQAWLDENPRWDEVEEIGKGVGATHVVYIDLTSYSLYEKHSHELYRGRAEGTVSVYEMDEDGNGEQVYDQELISQYPLAAPRSANEVSRPGFQADYMKRLSEEIGRLFYAHYNGDDMLDAA